ncbi:hypothetical protein ES332_D06G141900v1 [Gossypium tomentosum]|uniref:Uncharacterized protein n=1 Tax=Gossypium tomentosum TaxID=34277 RepID=A0A5D2KHX8_GOSTO|nr:hypothetical protein ES332_D06G141900v1 [Gossypium tomentosum]TYH66717.1 hypothetical protein ES332_D06G141900v1 [Gossypium tomentosum]
MGITLVPTQPQRDNQDSYEMHITTEGSSEAGEGIFGSQKLVWDDMIKSGVGSRSMGGKQSWVGLGKKKNEI